MAAGVATFDEAGGSRLTGARVGCERPGRSRGAAPRGAPTGFRIAPKEGFGPCAWLPVVFVTSLSTPNGAEARVGGS